MFKYKFIQDIAKLIFVNKIFLFDSRSRQNNTARSDVDLAINCKNAIEEDWLKIIALVEKADTLLKVDCVRLDTLQNENKLKQNIKKHGKVIYSKEYGFMNKEHWQDLFENSKHAVRQIAEVTFIFNIKMLLCVNDISI